MPNYLVAIAYIALVVLSIAEIVRSFRRGH